MILLRQIEHLLQNIRAHVDFHDHAVTLRYNLVSVLVQNVGDAREIRPFGDGGHDIILIVEDREPGPETIPPPDHIVHIHLMPAELGNHIRADPGVIHHADKRRAQLHIADILRDIPRHAAVQLHHAPRIASLRYELCDRVSLDIHENCSKNRDSHAFLPLSLQPDFC